jgi:hypothetical protein
MSSGEMITEEAEAGRGRKQGGQGSAGEKQAGGKRRGEAKTSQ